MFLYHYCAFVLYTKYNLIAFQEIMFRGVCVYFDHLMVSAFNSI